MGFLYDADEQRLPLPSFILMTHNPEYTHRFTHTYRTSVEPVHCTHPSNTHTRSGVCTYKVSPNEKEGKRWRTTHSRVIAFEKRLLLEAAIDRCLQGTTRLLSVWEETE